MRKTLLPAILMGLTLGVWGCSDATTRSDVAAARKDLKEEKQETAETIRESRDKVAEAQRDAREYTANKPVTSQNAAEAQKEVADAKQEAREEIADQRQDEREAAANLKETEQQHAATMARDAFVKDAEQKLKEAEMQIDQLKKSASAAEGQNADAINRQVEDLQARHDRAKDALNELKKAEVAQWQSHEEPVRVAIAELTTNTSNVR